MCVRSRAETCSQINLNFWTCLSLFFLFVFSFIQHTVCLHMCMCVCVFVCLLCVCLVSYKQLGGKHKLCVLVFCWMTMCRTEITHTCVRTHTLTHTVLCSCFVLKWNQKFQGSNWYQSLAIVKTDNIFECVWTC